MDNDLLNLFLRSQQSILQQQTSDKYKSLFTENGFS